MEWSVARKQHGVVSRAQLQAQGVSEDGIWRRRRSGILEEALPGVYRTSGAPRGWLQDLMAACLWGGEEAAASHRAAAALWELEGFEHAPVEISAPRRLQAGVSTITVHRRAVPCALATRKKGIPVTNAARTLRDLAGVVKGERLERALDHALRKGLTTVMVLRRTIDDGSRSRGTGVLRALIEQRGAGYVPSASEFQARVGRLLAGAGLRAVEEYEILVDGVFVARVDFAFPEERIVLEADGYATHSGRLDWQRDLNRRNGLTKNGWRVLHVTWEDLSLRPGKVVADVRDALGRRETAR